MPLLQNIIKETLRLHVPCENFLLRKGSMSNSEKVGFNIRTALKDTSLPTGGGLTGKTNINVPKGTHVGIFKLSAMLRESVTNRVASWKKLCRISALNAGMTS